MPSHFIESNLPYSKEKLFDLVADIASYPKFLPWCEAANIWERNEATDGSGTATVLADLLINFKGISGKYTSRVLLDKPQYEISVELAQGPLKHLYQGWKFFGLAENLTRVEFDIDFAMRSIVMEKIVGMMFQDACTKMMLAFRKRADELYGDLAAEAGRGFS